MEGSNGGASMRVSVAIAPSTATSCVPSPVLGSFHTSLHLLSATCLVVGPSVIPICGYRNWGSEKLSVLPGQSERWQSWESWDQGPPDAAHTALPHPPPPSPRLRSALLWPPGCLALGSY